MSRERSHQGVSLIVLWRSTLKDMIKALRSEMRDIFNPLKVIRLDRPLMHIITNYRSLKKWSRKSYRDSGHVWIIPFSEYIPYLFIAVVRGRTNVKSMDSAGDPVTIPAWTIEELLLCKDVPTFHNWTTTGAYTILSDFRMWSLQLRRSAYNMFSCPGVSVSWIFAWGLSLATLPS